MGKYAKAITTTRRYARDHLATKMSRGMEHVITAQVARMFTEVLKRAEQIAQEDGSKLVKSDHLNQATAELIPRLFPDQ
eukprot:m51a1_g3457 hypothetical protein (79) ;mRNA; r:689944-690180